ncbi:MAG: hypothetical protein N3A57_06525, partial [Negativicutes bacterium]|nr:hypothetical protein [Negativicutes bacterium]
MKISRRWRRAWKRRLEAGSRKLREGRHYLNSIRNQNTWRLACRRHILSAGATVAFLLSGDPAYALPQDGNIVGGEGTIAQTEAVMDITQN